VWTLIIQLYLAWSALLMTAFTLLLIREFKPNMLKTIIITAMVLFAGAETPTASAQPVCNYSPEELVRMTVNLKQAGDPNAAKTVVYDVFNNCADYETIFNNFTNKYGG